MNRNKTHLVSSIALVAAVILVLSGCRTSAAALTSRGRALEIDIHEPSPRGGRTEVLEVDVSNRGTSDLKDVLVDVRLPDVLDVLSQTNDRGIQSLHVAQSPTYHFIMDNMAAGAVSTIHFVIRTLPAYRVADRDVSGVPIELTGSVKVIAWQKATPGETLVETRIIRLNV